MEENNSEIKNGKSEKEILGDLKGHEESTSTSEQTNFFDFIMDLPGIEELMKSISNAINSLSNNRPKVTNYQFIMLIISIAFGIIVLAAIGIFGYLHIISRGVTGSLLGALIGYWYGQQKQNKK